jgi:hypothetical protein
VPTGRVEVREGRSVLGQARVGRDGAATLVLRGLKPGRHVLQASYAPRGLSFTGSTSAPVTVTVKAGPKG